MSIAKEKPGAMSRSRTLPRILHGEDEPIFDVLPESVLANLKSPASENAVLWNVLYPLAQPAIPLEQLLRVPYLWGTVYQEEDNLVPYFWGTGIHGERLQGLDAELVAMDGPGPKTEVDLFLAGERNLIVVEAKNRSGPGQCSRWLHGRCPAFHTPDDPACTYWVTSPGFKDLFRFLKPDAEEEIEEMPSCARHYQLARTLLLAHRLGDRLGLVPAVWMFVPRSRWRSLSRRWRAFTDNVIDAALWRRMRVISWEALQLLAGDGSPF